MQTVFRAIGKLSTTTATVLVQGESGTGKELIAKSLHKNSPRHDMPFIALNMADIPKELVESELFGHEKGAFTGAVDQRIGRFEQANGGTLFLDEIGDMPLDSQTRLLRVLSNKEFYRVGGDKPIKVDVRIIAETHQNLNNLVSQKSFREDLFYRLNVIKVNVPPLRERKEDIDVLTKYFLKNHSDSLGEELRVLSKEVMNVITIYDWPGNVRQLENIEYTPAPDIIHESAGHAPIIANPDYAEYLRRLGDIGSKAILSKHDMDLYEAVRKLSILKEAEGVSEKEIHAVEMEIHELQSKKVELSEMAQMRNLQWWTVEYGLIGDLINPKIYGTGLLSSIGESISCLKSDVKKIHYTMAAAQQPFEVTIPKTHL